ncbi:hypothetical protein VCRA2123O444_550002 [Vibrio crassostreae]|nr:hypothetical protein VCRA2117O428_520002 [Vibrio crassostreae]CAK2127077.1 hypothetical protein VCRA2113O416_520007 [Vibrio crassostreae]CAK2132862.1 hypothetical protein VCRA2119O430_530007 [Vibrio crassostreae]CAK2133189.1 hypothetical protein VCRA2114O422_560002 [Vibrio crassostreae]CAK2137026.1 hypothetical protein VCRA2119O431_530007 [Vibrio crassostreae]
MLVINDDSDTPPLTKNYGKEVYGRDSGENSSWLFKDSFSFHFVNTSYQ